MRLHLEGLARRGDLAQRRPGLNTVLACLAVAALAGSGRAATAFPLVDPRLASAWAPGSEPVGVWVEFADKGEQGPADLAARLARAERDLSPPSRARRLRTGVRPLVDYLDLPLAPAHLQALAAIGLQPYASSRWFNACAVRVSAAALARLALLDGVLRLTPAPLAAPRRERPQPVGELVEAGDPATDRASATASAAAAYGMTATQLARIGVPALHATGYTGAGVLVCLFDEGFDYYDKHAATRDIDVGGRTRDFVRGGTAVQDTVSMPAFFQHGEWTLSAIGGNAPGVYVGPAYGARYALARTEDSASEKPIEMVNWLMASEWADSLGADVISSSLGYRDFPDSAGTSIPYASLDGHSTIVTRAVGIAAAKGILVVNSAGNGGNVGGSLDAPADACGDSMLAVGAVDSLGNVAGFSSFGPTADGRIKPDVVAQGVAVLLASASGNANAYVRLNGTSFSCPLTAGVAACLIQARPNWTPYEIVRAIKLTAGSASSPNNSRGWGQIDGGAALNFDTAGVSAASGALRFAVSGANPAHLGSAPARFVFSLPSGTPASAGAVRVFDVSGRQVRTLWSGRLARAEWRVAQWDGADGDGRALPSGLYFVSFETADQRATLRLAAVR